MALRRIVTTRDQDPVLRTAASPVRRVDREVRELMDDMVETMRRAPGVGLAAPQVGASVRVIVVETPVDPNEPDGMTRLHALADPEIVSRDPAMEEDQEACLSIPGLYGDVPRHVSVRVRGIDRSGKRVEIDATGFEARVFQHEVDHLDGILFTDRVSGLDKLYTIGEDEHGEAVRIPVGPALDRTGETVPAMPPIDGAGAGASTTDRTDRGAVMASAVATRAEAAARPALR